MIKRHQLLGLKNFLQIIPGIPKVVRRYTGVKKPFEEAIRDWATLIASDNMSAKERSYVLDEAQARCFEKIEDGDPYNYEEELDRYWEKKYEYCKKHNFDISLLLLY